MAVLPARYADSPHWRQTAEIHADADGHLARLCLSHDHPHLLRVADVAGVQPQAIDALIQRLQRELVVEVDIRDDGDRDLALDGAERLRSLHVGHGAADNLATRLLQPVDLVNGRLHVARVRLRHGLNADGSVAAHLYITHPYRLRNAALHVPLLRFAARPFSSAGEPP